MTEEAEFAAIGRMTSERAQAERKLAILRGEAQRISKALSGLSMALRNEYHARYIEFDDERLKQQPPYPGFKQEEYRFESALIDGQKIKQLCKEIREHEDTVASLSQKLKTLGV